MASGAECKIRTYDTVVMAGRVGIEPTQARQPPRLLALRPFVLFPQPLALPTELTRHK